MPITYPVPAGSLWTVVNAETHEIIDRNKPWPREDRGQIEGLDPSILYLEQKPLPVIPQYDSRYYVLQTSEVIDEAANEVRFQVATVKRDVSEIVNAAANVEIEKARGIVDLERLVLENYLATSALAQVVMKNQVLPVRIKNFLDKVIEKGTKLWQNRDKFDAAKTAIEAGQEPNLDTGWVES